ncbi:RDD family protein [Metabacillus idriensis]|uniref:RDD family protein n=1 Tax=Metabacillus idriensis TaxID=324768 RepID=UPI00174E0674
MDATFEEEHNHEQPLQKFEESHPVMNVHYAGFWLRFWAYLIDLIVIGSVNRILFHPLFSWLDIPTSDRFIFSPIQICTALSFYLYFVFMTKYLGQTLGKMVFGLRVVSLHQEKLTWSTVLFRELIGRFISKFTWIGYLVTAFTPKKQGVHDLFAETTVTTEYMKKNEPAAE